MTNSKPLQDLLDRLDPDQALDMAKFVEAVYAARFTGSFTVECFNGRPRQINLGQPLRFAICAGEERAAEGGGLDKRPAGRSG